MPRKKHQPRSRPPMARMLRIHAELQSGVYPNCRQLAAQMEVCVRTILRDLDFMRDQLGLPMAYDEQRFGFCYTRPVEHFPGVPMTEAELFALLVAGKAVAQYEGTPFHRPLESAFRKLTGQLAQERVYSLQGLDQAFSFRPFAPEDTDLTTFEVLTRALREHRVIQFVYRNLGAARVAHRRVEPYHLACIDSHWYLFAFDLDRQDWRTFSLTRLTGVRVDRANFRPERGFDINRHLQDSFGVFKGRDDFEVVVEFDRWASDLVRGRRWHPSQELTELGGGVLRLRLRLDNLEEVERWVLSFGTRATVVRPRLLAERIARTAATLRERYAR